MGIIYDSADTSSVGQMNAVKAGAPKLGVALKGIEAFSNGDQDFSAQLTDLLSDPPDLLYVGATTNEAWLIISQARAFGLKSLMIGSTTGLAGVDGTFTYKGSGDNTEQRPYVFELTGGQFRRVS